MVLAPDCGRISWQGASAGMNPLKGLYCRVTMDLLEMEQLPYLHSTKVEMMPLPSASSQSVYTERVSGGSSVGPSAEEILRPPEKLCVCHQLPVIMKEM